MNTLTINGLEVETVIGAFDWEKQIKQRLLIDLSYQISDASLQTQDELKPEYGYGKLCEKIRDYLVNENNQLLETLGQKIADFLSHECGLSHFRLTLHKPACVPGVKQISLTLGRGSLS